MSDSTIKRPVVSIPSMSIDDQLRAGVAGPASGGNSASWYNPTRPWSSITSGIEAATSAIPAGAAGIPGHIMGGVMSGVSGLFAQTENAMAGRHVDTQAVTSGMMNVAAPELLARPTGSLKTFGGVGAAEADMTALKAAQAGGLSRENLTASFGAAKADRIIKALEAAPNSAANPEKIWRETGWFKGADDKWRFEISDAGSSWTGSAPFSSGATSVLNLPRGGSVKLGDVFDHPDLFKNYPDLKNLPVTTVSPMDELLGTRGWTNKEGTKIAVGRLPADEARSTLLHEIQHLVQKRENFARGGNTDEFLPKGHSNEKYAASKEIKEHSDVLSKNGIYDYEIGPYLAGKGRYSDALTAARKVLSPVEMEKIKSYGDRLKSVSPIYEKLKSAGIDKYKVEYALTSSGGWWSSKHAAEQAAGILSESELTALKEKASLQRELWAIGDKLRPEVKSWMDVMHGMRDAASVEKAKQILGPEKFAKYEQANKRLAKARTDEDAAFSKYRGLAGEVESRNVQERLKTGSKEYPTSTADTPVSGQIVKPQSGDAGLIERARRALKPDSWSNAAPEA